MGGLLRSKPDDGRPRRRLHATQSSNWEKGISPARPPRLALSALNTHAAADPHPRIQTVYFPTTHGFRRHGSRRHGRIQTVYFPTDPDGLLSTA